MRSLPARVARWSTGPQRGHGILRRRPQLRQRSPRPEVDAGLDGRYSTCMNDGRTTPTDGNRSAMPAMDCKSWVVTQGWRLGPLGPSNDMIKALSCGVEGWTAREAIRKPRAPLESARERDQLEPLRTDPGRGRRPWAAAHPPRRSLEQCDWYPVGEPPATTTEQPRWFRSRSTTRSASRRPRFPPLHTPTILGTPDHMIESRSAEEERSAFAAVVIIWRLRLVRPKLHASVSFICRVGVSCPDAASHHLTVDLITTNTPL
jgi:hypothetical protein